MAKALAPEASAGSGGPKFSSRLMQMKFMQRGKPVRTLTAEEEAAQDTAPEEAKEQLECEVRGGAAGGCWVVAEADPRPDARLGRMSFAGKSAVEEADAGGGAARDKQDPEGRPEAAVLPTQCEMEGPQGVKRKAEGWNPNNGLRPNKLRHAPMKKPPKNKPSKGIHM